MKKNLNLPKKKTGRLRNLFLTVCLLASVAASAQEKTVTGTVTDALGDPLIGATVLVQGTSNGVITDIDGRYSIQATPENTLDFSYVGMVKQAVKVGSQSVINVQMKDDSQMLAETVVIGYGSAKKRDLTGSITNIKGDEIANKPVVNPVSALQGKIAGVQVINSGKAGSDPEIRVRGTNSINGYKPLYVVDGLFNDNINFLNPQDIESMEILKDPSSLAIFGVRGANGVIIITTKKAKEGKTSLSYDATFGVRKASNVIEPLNAEEQLEMRKLSYANAGLTLPTGWDLTKNPWVGTTRTNWMDEIFRTAFYQRHNVALNVGSENASNRVSFAYDNDEGVLINTFNKNLSLRYNGKFKLNKWVTITEDVVWKNNESRSKDTDSGYTGVVAAAMYMPASATVYNPLDGTYGGTTTEDPDYIAKYGSNFADIHGDAVNPVRLLEAENRYDRTSDIWSTTSLELANIVTGLKFTSRFTYNLKNNLYKNFSPIRDEVGKPSLTNNLDETTYRADAWKTENTLTYDNTFNDMHTVGVLLSTTADHYSKRGLEVNGKDLSDESAYLQYLSYANSVSATDYLTGPDANVSLIARLAYSFRPST